MATEMMMLLIFVVLDNKVPQKKDEKGDDITIRYALGKSGNTINKIHNIDGETEYAYN